MSEETTDVEVPEQDRRKTLKDLFMVGRLETLTDGENEVTVYLQKLNGTLVEKCYKAANKAKAQTRALLKADDDNEDRAMHISDVDEQLGDKDALIAYLIAEDLDKAEQSAEARLADEDEWSKEGYLDGLKDSWYGSLDEDEDSESLQSIYLSEDEESDRWKEADKVYGEITRFYQAVEAEVKEKRNELVYELQDLSFDTLREKVIAKYIADIAQADFFRVYFTHQIYHATRDPDRRSEYIFSSPSEVGELQPETYKVLQNAITQLNVSSTEGKE